MALLNMDEDHLLILHEAFSMYDDGDGSIDCEEFIHLMKSLGLTLSKMEATDMLREADYYSRLRCCTVCFGVIGCMCMSRWTQMVLVE